MGIRGLLKLINENRSAVCERSQVPGELVVDGYAILHELYDCHNHLDWGSGGRYALQHSVTVKYFEALVGAGVRPIVVVDGGGCATQHEDTVYRRNRNIVDIPGLLEKHHRKEAASHTMPVMAREVFVTSLKSMEMDVHVADGKAIKTIVRLANHYNCPVLTNNTNYCVCGLASGVIFYKHFDVSSCMVDIYRQSKLVQFCRMRNPDLVYAILAVMGDGSDTSLPYLYHGRIKARIKDSLKSVDTSYRSWVCDIVDFLQAKRIASYDEFKAKLKALDFGKQGEKLVSNCQKIDQLNMYYSKLDQLSTEELKVSTTMQCSKPCDLPIPILERYRNGTFPVLGMNAITLGKCVLEQFVGDQEQPPFTALGLPVRQVIYGLLSTLMNRKEIEEYHRATNGSLCYEAHRVGPVCKYGDLDVTKIRPSDEKTQAVQVICEVLECTEDIMHQLKGESDKSLTIVSLATRYWAKQLLKRDPLPNPKQLIKALVINFFLNLSDPEVHRQPVIDKTSFFKSDWIKVYHALLEWQSLYCNVCSLNFVLQQPLEMRSPSFLFDGPLIIFLALNDTPQIIDTYIHRLEPDVKVHYEKVLQIVSL